MASTTFDTHERSPEGVLRRKTLSTDEPRPFNLPVSTSNLRGQRQEQFIQKPLSKEVTYQLRPTLDQDYLALVGTAHLPQDGSGTEYTSAWD